MRKLFFGLFFIASFITFLPFKGYLADDIEEEIKIYMGQTKVISVSTPKRVAVGNPAIADVANIGKSELTVVPKAVGNTTLIVWDNFGEQAYRLRVFAEDTADLKRRIDHMLKKLNLPNVYTSAEDEEGKVALLGTVKHAADREIIATALGALKGKTVDLIVVKEEESVIEIDVQVIEINRGSQDTLGFTWPSSMTLTEVGSPGIAGTAWGKVFHVVNESRAAFTLKLDALIKEGKARILSRPRVSCQSGKEAKLLVGGEVPVLSGSVTPGTSGETSVGATTGASVEYKEYGIILNVKPSIEDSGRIHLNLDVSVSEVGDVVSTSYALAYKMTKRTATTELFLDDGQTMAIGGLIKKKSSEELTRVPWLSDIPVLGLFFRQRTTSRGWNSDLSKADDTELFITLTPRVITQKEPLRELKPSISGTPTLNDDDIKDPVVRYAKIIQRKILDSLTYPIAAKEAGFQGKVKLSLKLSAQGDLLNSKVKEPSSYRLLDENAIRTAQKIVPYPPFPPAIKEAQLWVDVPIIYQLE
ncbi:MAG: TonB family protein [Candidatus Omnitrophica bacterium]|nr:TonB family protein [Candidatus Omnitrophota bacterium]MBU1922835.1 TonB family protein [Candidatus Omnitrophota bacterium]